MSQRTPTGNFDHLLRLSMLESGAMLRIIEQLQRAERLYDFDAELSAVGCRRALEILARQFENQLRIDRDRESGGSDQAARLRAIESHYRENPPFPLGDVWASLYRLNSQVLNKVTHGERSFFPEEAIKCLRDFHSLTFRICKELVPDLVHVEYRVPRGISDELLEYRSNRIKAEQVAAKAIEDRERSSSELERASAALEQLRATPAPVRSDRDRALLLASEEQVRRLQERLDELDDQVRRAEADRERFAERNKGLTAELDSLREITRGDTAAHTEVRRQLARLANYRDGYPESPRDVPGFLAASLQGDCDGPLPPFESISDLRALPSDPHADRWEASHAGRRCTLRLVTTDSRLGPEELLRAWMIEARNVERLRGLRGRAGIVDPLLAPDPGKPGFVALARPAGPTLDRFGRDGRVLDLASGLDFTLALHGLLVARDHEGFVASWPDAGAIAVSGAKPILLEPTATHFGDLGPESFLGNGIDAIRLAGQHVVEPAWAFVLAHAFLRAVGILPCVRDSRPLQASVAADSVRDALSESRRRCDVPITAGPLPDLSGLLCDALSPDAPERPPLARLVEGLLAPLV